MGVRWDYFQRYKQKDDKFVNIELNGFIVGNTVDTTTSKFGRELMDSDWNNVGPRFGFAWRPPVGETVVRGGYGIYYTPQISNAIFAMAEGAQATAGATLNGNIVGAPNLFFSNPFAGAVTNGALNFAVSNDEYMRDSYVQQWNLNVQHKLPGNVVLDVGYVGSKGTKLGRQRDLNQLYPTPASQNPYLPSQAPITQFDCAGISLDPLTGVATATPGTYTVDQETGPTTYTSGMTSGWANNLAVACSNDANPLRPFYGVSTITRLENKASSIYHALQISARRTVGQLSLSLAYTYSHSIDDSSDRYDGAFVNSYDIASSRASSSFDQRHMLNVGYDWNLPFFRQKGLTHTLLGGWEWSGIIAFSTGTPFTVTNGTTYGDNAGVGNGVGTGSYAEVIGNPKAGIPPASAVSQSSDAGFFYNPAAFGVPAGLTFGNAGRNGLRNPNRTNIDMALFKNFAIKESMSFQFRAEAFNIFNHSEWTGPSGDMSATDGQPSSGFLEIPGAHLARVLQLGLKFIF
jgi:hypothetical protein